MTTRTPMIEWSMSTVYALWHASKVFPDGKVVRLCQMRYETHHTEGEPPVGATVCSMCAAGLSKSYEHALAILGRLDEASNGSRDVLSNAQDIELWSTVMDTLGRS